MKKPPVPGRAARRLREERQRLGLSLSQLGQRLGVSTGQVWRWETGRAPVGGGRRAMLMAIARLTGRTPEYYTNDEEPLGVPPSSTVTRELARIAEGTQALLTEVERIAASSSGQGADWSMLMALLRATLRAAEEERAARQRPPDVGGEAPA